MRSKFRLLLAAFLAFALIAGACGDDDSADPAPDDQVETDPDGGETPPEPDATADTDPAPDAGEPVDGGDLTIGINSDSNSFYPVTAQWATTGGVLVASSMFDHWVRPSSTGDLELELAAALEPNEDFTAWTLTIRDGITFHNGAVLDADNVIAQRDLWAPEFGTLLAGIGSVEKVDDMSVVFNLLASDPAFPEQLGGPQGAVFDGLSTTPESDPVGTGPFMFNEWVRDSHLTVDRFDNYWRADDVAHLDSITFRILPDRDTRHASLRSGDIDMAAEHGSEGVPSLIDDGFVLAASEPSDSRTIDMNVLVAPLDDLRVRRSLAHALNPENRAAITELLPGQEYSVRNQYFAEGAKWHNAAAGQGVATYDAEMSQTLHDEYMNDPARSDGKAPGEPISFGYMCNADPNLFVDAQLFQSEWQTIGYEVELLQLEQATLLGAFIGGPTDEAGPFAGTYQVTCNAQSGLGDPLTIFRTSYGPPATSIVNITNYSSAAIDEAIITLSSTDDFDIRLEAVGVVADDIADNTPTIYGPSVSTLLIMDEKVQGIDDWTYPDGREGTRLPQADAYWPALWLDG